MYLLAMERGLESNLNGFNDFAITEEQITKLRRIAVGILPLSAFTSDELLQLASKLHAQLS